jgi:hypothetical protein
MSTTLTQPTTPAAVVVGYSHRCRDGSTSLRSVATDCTRCGREYTPVVAGTFDARRFDDRCLCCNQDRRVCCC